MTELVEMIVRAAKEPDSERLRVMLNQFMQHLHDTAPDPWEVSADLEAILVGKPARCQVPRGLSSLGIGMPIVFDGQSLTIAGEPVDMQKFREAIMPAQLPPALYFGPWDQAGHYLCDRNGRYIYGKDPLRFGFKDHRLGLSKGLDPCYCPGWLPDGFKRSRSEVEGEAKLTHEAGVTVLGIWDRSIDKRGGCHSTYIALGTYSAEKMIKLCELAFPRRWNLLADRVQIRIVEKEDL